MKYFELFLKNKNNKIINEFLEDGKYFLKKRHIHFSLYISHNCYRN